MRRLLRFQTVKEKTALGHTKIYEGIAEGWFPAPVKVGARGVRWVEDEIDAYIEAKIAERDAS